jgi:hypothetical protein
MSLSSFRFKAPEYLHENDTFVRIWRRAFFQYFCEPDFLLRRMLAKDKIRHQPFFGEDPRPPAPVVKVRRLPDIFS